MSIIASAFEPLAGKRILDVGCGPGALARSLVAEGALVTGVDPNGEAIEVARRAVPTGIFLPAVAQALPLADRAFGGVVFLNSLHHVPEMEMPRALREAARVVRPGGPVVVVEPLAEGSYFRALQPVEDESVVRTAAQRAIGEAAEGGAFARCERTDYLRREHFANLDRFLARIVAVDPARVRVVERRRREVEAAFRRYARAAADGGAVLEQPMRAFVLRTEA